MVIEKNNIKSKRLHSSGAQRVSTVNLSLSLFASVG